MLNVEIYVFCRLLYIDLYISEFIQIDYKYICYIQDFTFTAGLFFIQDIPGNFRALYKIEFETKALR